MSVTWHDPEGVSVKERIIRDIASTLEAIREVDGYSMDMKEVTRFRIAPWDVALLPAASVVGVREDFTPIEGQPPRYNVVLAATITGVLTQDPTDDTEEAHNQFLRDVEQALQVDITRGGYASDTAVLATELELGFDDAPFGAPSLLVQVTYQRSRSDPTRSFSQQ